MEAKTCLIDYKSFYGNELKTYHIYSFVKKRLENHEQEITENKVFDKINEFLKSRNSFLAICGEAGMGKSRILIELAKNNKKIKFINLQGFKENLNSLEDGLKTCLKEKTILALDNYQDYPALFSKLLDTFHQYKPKIIASSRNYSSLKEKLDERRFTYQFLNLGKMENVSDLVPSPEIKDKINAISEGNPATAIMAYEHWKKTDTLIGIDDKFDLMNSILRDLQAKFSFDVCVPLAEIAILRGVKINSEKAQTHYKIIDKLKEMKHITEEGTGTGKIYKIVPDRLADFIIESAYFRQQLISPYYIELLQDIKNPEFLDISTSLSILNTQKEREIFSDACTFLLKEIKARKDVSPEIILELGFQTYDTFGSSQLITENLGEFWEEALKIKKVNYINRAGNFLYVTGKTEEAEKYWTEGLGIARKEEDRSGEAGLLYNIAILKQYQENYKEAMGIYEESMKISEESGDKKGMATTIHQMGIIQYQQGNFKEAMEFYSDSMKIKEELGDKQGIATLLSQMGRLFEKKDNMKNAVFSYMLALKIFDELNSPDKELAKKEVDRIKNYLGEEDFNKILLEIGKKLKE